VVQQIFHAIKLGSTIKHAALGVGIREQTIHEWAAAKPEFADGLKVARAKKIEFCLSQIIRIGLDTNNWTAFAWVLERTEPALFSKQIALSHTDGPVMTEEERIEKMKQILGIYKPSSRNVHLNGKPISTEERQSPDEPAPVIDVQPEPPGGGS
jgi:hypothetical protein